MSNFNHSVLSYLEIGSLASVLCHGVLIMQAHNYFSSCPDDARGLKLAVAAIWIGALAHLACILCGTYILTVANLGLAPEFVGIPLALIVSAGFGGFVRSTVQSIYTYRMYKYSGSLYIPVLCWSLSAYEFVAGIIVSVTQPSAPFGVQMWYLNNWSWVLYSLFVSCAFVDVVIAGSLCYYLRKDRSRSMELTLRVINRLVIWTIQTGVFTSLTAIATMISFAVDETNFAWFGLLNFLTNFYPVALLALLNDRSNLKFDHPASGAKRRDLASSSTTLNIPPAIMLKDRSSQLRVTVGRDELPVYHIISDSHRNEVRTDAA